MITPVPVSLESRPDGGLGLHIVQELAHELSYRREGERNLLRIVRRIPEP